MVSGTVFDGPPAGGGLRTVTFATAPSVISSASMKAISWTGLLKKVERVRPLISTTDPLIKPEPLTTRLNAAPPASIVLGDSVVITGTGLGGGGCTSALAMSGTFRTGSTGSSVATRRVALI